MNPSITESLVHFEGKKGNFFKRNLAPMDVGSLRGSVFSLICTTVGAGILSMPFILRSCGYVIGIVIIILGGILSLTYSMLLMDSQMMTGVKSFPELVKITLGPASSRFLEFITVLTGYSISVAYFVVLATDIEQLLYTFFFSKESVTQPYVWYLIISGATFLELPLVLRKNIDQLRYSSFLGVMSAVYPALLVCFLSPAFIVNEFYPRTYTPWKFTPSLITSFSIGLFSYECQILAIPVKLELRNPTDSRVFKIFRLSIVIEMILYSSVAILGYAVNGDLSPQLITQIPPLYTGWILFKITMNIAILLVVIHMWAATPTLQLPARDQLIRTFQLDPENKLTHVCVTLGLLFSSSITAMFFTDIIAVLSVVGGFTSCFFLVVFPGFTNASLHLKKNKKRAYAVIVGTCFFAVLCILSCVLGALDQFGIIELDDA